MAGSSGLSSVVQDMVEGWLKWDQNPATRQEITGLVQAGKETNLKVLLGSRMEFGTAGLRAVMGAGYCKMNELTIIQTTQGLASYLLQQFQESQCASRGVVVGYDARHNSKRFAELAAAVFLSKKIKVYLFSGHTPTPYTPYAVKVFKCLAGVQVTASHNPKQYNGYKVYWDNGAQIIPPIDREIAASIEQELEPWPASWGTPVDQVYSQVTDPTERVLEGYYKEIKRYCYRPAENSSGSLRVTFTPMHGVGGIPVQKAFKAFGLNDFIPVVEQMEPDPEFPTVSFPNPEEGKSALDLAIKTADSAGCCIILATDPDADRLALAERDAITGKWKIFSGNEIGALLSWWALKTYRDTHPHFDGSKVCMLASTVSSRFVKVMADEEGFQFIECLTGFKWMGNKAHDAMLEGKDIVFAFEEAIGFMFGDTVLDKDGISAAAIMAEYAGWLYSQNLTFKQQLEHLYTKYGRHLSEVSYFKCNDKEVIAKIFNRLRKNKEYPATCGSAGKVTSVVDLTVGYDSSRPDFKPVLPEDPNSQLITFTFDTGALCTLRTSGTEPKVKYYVEVSNKPGSSDSEEDLYRLLQRTVECLVSEFLQPDKHGLIRRD